MNKEEKNILKIIFACEYYKNNITERYMRNLSENVVLDNDCLDIENLELIYVIPFKKYNQLKNENARLKDKLIEINEVINGYMPNQYAMCKAFDEIEFIISKGVE